MNEKYGFVYVWRDNRHKMFYVGCHWGRSGDGYICSSTRMRKAYRRRPQDFKRRIIETNITREDLLLAEYNWLAKIKDEELGKKYYNLSKKHFGHWSEKTEKRISVGQKISASPERRQRISESHKGKKLSEETKEKLRSFNLGKILSKETRKKIGESQLSLNRKRPDVSLLNRTRLYSEEEKRERTERNKKLHSEGKIGMHGRKHSPETLLKMSLAAKARESEKKLRNITSNNNKQR